MAKIPVFGEILPGVRYVDRPGTYGFLLNERRELAVLETSFGVFLPGGGLDPGESLEAGLSREIFEEMGARVTAADLLMRAIQYHWSEFYGRHFRKIGFFYRLETSAPAAIQAGHKLLWLSDGQSLSQEFQRWAAEEFLLQG